MTQHVVAPPASPTKQTAIVNQYFWGQKASSKPKNIHPYHDIQRRQTLDTRHSSREKSLPPPNTTQVGFFPIIGKPKYNLQEALICVTKLNYPGTSSTQSQNLQKKSFDAKPPARDKPLSKQVGPDSSTKSTTHLFSPNRF